MRPLFFRERLLRAALLSCVALWLAPPVHGQTSPDPVVQQRSQEVDQLFNWYYASVYGTGYYKIGEQGVAALRVPLAYTFRQATEEQWGLKLTVPVTLAFAQFDLTDFDLGRISTAGMTIFPGLEAEIALGPNWTVKPFANLGMGREFQRDSSALIYALGATTVHDRTIGDHALFALGGKLV